MPHHYFCLAGVTKTHSFTLEIESSKQLDAESQTGLLEFLRDSIRLEGEVGAAEWKDDEIEQRWKKR